MEIVADDGRVLRRDVRSGLAGTGSTWIWRHWQPGETSAPA